MASSRLHRWCVFAPLCLLQVEGQRCSSWFGVGHQCLLAFFCPGCRLQQPLCPHSDLQEEGFKKSAHYLSNLRSARTGLSFMVHRCVFTCLEDQQVQRIVSQVGGSSDLMCGNPHQQLLIVSPRQQQTASRQTQNTVLIDTGLQRKNLQLLLTNTQGHVTNDYWSVSQTLLNHRQIKSYWYHLIMSTKMVNKSTLMIVF